MAHVFEVRGDIYVPKAVRDEKRSAKVFCRVLTLESAGLLADKWCKHFLRDTSAVFEKKMVRRIEYKKNAVIDIIR